VGDNREVGDELAIGVLGPLVATRSGAALRLGGPKPQALLAVLLASRDAVVSADRLCDALWGECWPPAASTSLQSHVSRLRSALSPGVTLRASPPGYRLEITGATFDAAGFEQRVEQAAGCDSPRTVAALLGEGLEVWRGEAYSGFAELAAIQPEATRLTELRWSATEDWIDARMALHQDTAVIGELESLVLRQPLRERFWRQLMLSLYRTGRQADALRRATMVRTVLRDELGLDPSPRLRDLEARIRADDPDLLPADRTTPTGPSRTPPSFSEATSFVGRAHAVVEIGTALDAQRLVTITGPGGVGKTRLARRVGLGVAERFGHGATMVELAALREPEAVAQVLAGALDIQQRQHRSMADTVVEYLADRHGLLILDNCEHLVAAVAGLVERILLHCPQVSVLTTSRQPLGLAGEYVHGLNPLAVPDTSARSVEQLTSSPAVQLFVDRVAAARPGFELTADNAGAVAEICRRLDGLPLALELAAPRLRVLGADALADRLDQRFGLLGDVRHGGQPRQRTLQALVDWSHDLLDPAQQQVFAQLSVFAGSFDLHDAEAVCVIDGRPGAVIETLADLVDKSMVQLSDPDEPRYVLLETLRQYGHGRLAERGALGEVERRHLGWYRQLAHRGAAEIDGPEEGAWSRRMDRELDNFRAAHATAVRHGDAEAAAHLVIDLREFSFRRIRYEVTSWAEATLELNGLHDSPLLPVVRSVAAYGRWVRGDLEAALELAEQAAADQDRIEGSDPSGLAERVLGNTLFYLGRGDEAVVWMDRMAHAAHRSGSAAQRAHALYMRSVAETSLGHGVRGAVLAGEARVVSESCGSPTAQAQAEYALGLALQGTDPVTGAVHLRRSAELAQAGGNRWVNGFALTEVHWLVARSGDPLAGLRGFADVVDTWYRGGDWANLWLSVRHLFGIVNDLGEHRTAAVLHGALTATGAAYALPYEPAAARLLAGEADVLRRRLGPVEYAAAVRRGAAMTDGEIVAHVMAEIDRLCPDPD
jgi:predicted ATPase/DNA-binding SARP family transcriptional activator